MVAVVVGAAAVAGPGALPQPDHRLEAAERVHVIHVEVPGPGLLATGVVLPADGEMISVSSQAATSDGPAENASAFPNIFVGGNGQNCTTKGAKMEKIDRLKYLCPRW